MNPSMGPIWSPPPERKISKRPWTVLIVDDDEDVHAITRVALADFEYDGRPLSLMSAYSGAESVEMVRQHPSIAMVLMDVVMDSDDDGLQAVRKIREQLNRWDIRIVLRTGQPGLAPEREVVRRYDINDYAEKSEITSSRLFTLVYTGLSLYQKIQALLDSRASLHQVGLLTRHLYQHPDMNEFGRAIVYDTVALYRQIPGNQRIRINSFVIKYGEDGQSELIAEHVEFGDGNGPSGEAMYQCNVVKPGRVMTSEQFVVSRSGQTVSHGTAWILEGDGPISHPEPDLLDLYLAQASIALENILLQGASSETQQEMLSLLGGAIEHRSKETGNHIRRVAEISARLAQLAGLPPEDVATLKHASPLHDAGKIMIPDAILNKPGRHDEEEREIMQSHALAGEQMLSNKNRPLLDAAAIIAGQHHERWDGTGYPRALKEDEIHIFGRITALADVFDALCAKRCYKPAWPVDKAVALVADERGKHFDPKLVDLFLLHLEEFVDILNQYED